MNSGICKFVAQIGALALVASVGLLGCSKTARSDDAPTSAAPMPSGDKAMPSPAIVARAAKPTPGTAGHAANPAAIKPTLTTGAVAAVAAAKPGPTAIAAVPTGTQNLGDGSYKLVVNAPETLAPGVDSQVKISITPSKGWKMNKEFPTKLKITVPAGVAVTKPVQTITDAARFDDHGAVFAVAFRADAPGPKSFTAKLKFAVCTDATCDPKKQELAWNVDIK